jgi:hypothetical protein
MKLAPYVRLAALSLVGLQLASCVPPGDRPFRDPLDHTPSATIHDPSECACLARLKLVADPMSKTPCLSAASAGSCAIRLDCVAPEAPEALRQAAQSCEAGH